MNNLRIYRLAMNELLRMRGVESDRLEKNPNGQIAKNRLKKLDNEIAELHEKILQEEQSCISI